MAHWCGNFNTSVENQNAVEAKAENVVNARTSWLT